MADARTGNVADLVTEAAARAPGQLAFIDHATGRSLTWQQVDSAVDAYAASLLAAGLVPGDRVAIVQPTSPEFAVALFAVLRAGGIAVPIGTHSPAPELERILDDCGAAFLVGEPAGSVPTVLAPPDLDETAEAPDLRADGPRGGEDIAVLCYTSGTAGVPRGVMLSHRALLSNVDQCAALKPAPVTASDRVLLVVPLFHAYGLGPGLLQVAAAGATAVLMESFSAERALAACAEYRITALVGVPAMYQAFAAAPADVLTDAMSSLRLLTSGAAPLSPAVLAAMKEATGLSVYEGYGLTETGPVLTSTLVGGHPKPGSVGRPIPGVELTLVDSDGRPVGGAPDPDEPAWFDDDGVRDRPRRGPRGEPVQRLLARRRARPGRRRLVPHRRRRLPRRRRRPAARRPGQRPDHRERVQRLPQRGRAGPGRAGRGARVGRGRRARRADRRVREGRARARGPARR